ncbi:MAG: hypothetical protein WCG27_10290, partial [Pseudomonadota bacterium]
MAIKSLGQYVLLILFLLIMTLLIASLPASAGPNAPYDEQMQWLQNAFTNAGIPTSKIEQFRNYQAGPNSFRLNSANAPWAGHWWPWKKGGIAYRWQVDLDEKNRIPTHPWPKVYHANIASVNIPEVDDQAVREEDTDGAEITIATNYATLDAGFNSVENVKKMIQNMTPQEINKLSPVEKFDLYVGDYRFSATKHSKENRGTRPPLSIKKITNSWSGYC